MKKVHKIAVRKNGAQLVEFTDGSTKLIEINRINYRRVTFTALLASLLLIVVVLF